MSIGEEDILGWEESSRWEEEEEQERKESSSCWWLWRKSGGQSRVESRASPISQRSSEVAGCPSRGNATTCIGRLSVHFPHELLFCCLLCECMRSIIYRCSYMSPSNTPMDNSLNSMLHPKYGVFIASQLRSASLLCKYTNTRQNIGDIVLFSGLSQNAE